jgi:hypothetical protein
MSSFQGRPLRPRACSVRCIPIGVRTTGIRRKLGVRWTSAGRRRCIGPYSNWGSRSFPRIPRKRGAARSASSAPCKIGCPKSWPWLGSRRWRRPTAPCRSGFSPRTITALPCRRPKRHRLCAVDRDRPRRCALRPGRARGGQGQYGALCGPESAAAAKHASVSLCEGHGAGACVSGCEPSGVPWAAVFGALPAGWSADRDRRRPRKPPRPNPEIGHPADRSS